MSISSSSSSSFVGGKKSFSFLFPSPNSYLAYPSGSVDGAAEATSEDACVGVWVVEKRSVREQDGVSKGGRERDFSSAAARNLTA